MQRERIGATWVGFAMGDTFILLDDRGGMVHLQKGGAISHEIIGESLGSMARGGEFFDLLVERKGEELKVLVNGTEALSTPIHELVFGPMFLHTGFVGLHVESLVVEGTMVEKLDCQILHKKGMTSRNLSGMQRLLRTKDGGLLAVSDPGGQWKRVGPLMDRCWRGDGG